MYLRIIFLVLLCSCFGNGLFSQTPYDVQIITEANDTLNGTMKVETKFRFKGFVLPSSFNRKVNYTDENGKNTKISAINIHQLNFKDKTGTFRNFVHLQGENGLLVEDMYNNQVKWYKNYYSNRYDYDNVEDIFFDETGKEFKSGMLSVKKKVLRRLTKDNSEIKSFIKKNKMTDEMTLEVLKMYESKL